MYNIAICDDGENVCTELEEMLVQYQKRCNLQINIDIWNTGEGLHDYLINGNSLDIIFLDIELLKLSGIEVADFIRNELENRIVQIIYISSKQIYAQSLFKTQPLDFLVKPIVQKQVNDVMDLALKIIGKNNKCFEFQNNKNYLKIPYGEIMYFCSSGRIIRIVLRNKEYEFYGKLGEISATLPDEFILIHKSYILNINYVINYTYELVELTNNTILNISKSNRKIVRKRILDQGKEV